MFDISSFKKTFFISHYFWWIVLASFIPLIVMVYLSIQISKYALKNEAMSTLSIVANNKVNSIESFIGNSKKNVSLFAKNPFVIAVTKNASKIPLAQTQANGHYMTATKELIEYSKFFFEKTDAGYTDIILLSLSGKIIFSLKEPKLIEKNYLETELKQTQLVNVFNNVITLLETEISNFEYDKMTKAVQAYIAVPVLENQKPIGVLVLQMGNKSITKVVNNIEGLGYTGETLVGKINGRKIIPEVPLRYTAINDFTKLKDINPSMIAAFKDATEGGKGEGFLKDYHGQNSIGVWRYIPSLGWGMLITVNTAEAFAPIIALEKNLIIFGCIAFLFAAIIAYIISKRLKLAEENFKTLSHQLADVARQAGMSEVATSVLHNVGNVLNSVNVSNMVISEKITHSKLKDLPKISELIKKHESDLSRYLTEDPKGKLLPSYIIALANSWKKDYEIIEKELNNLHHFIEHIKKIVSMQQSLSGTSNAVELISLNELLENSMKIASIEKHHIRAILDYHAIDMIKVDKNKLMQVLINLITNARDSINSNNQQDKVLAIRTRNLDKNRLQIQVIDNGTGISKEIVDRIFNYGFTTKKEGHGFGLHSSALAAKEMGGSLTAYSEGMNKGATFTLEIAI